MSSQVPEGYKQTEVGVIPEDWTIQRLDHLTEQLRPISYGIVQTGSNVADGVPCLRVVDIKDGRIDTSNLIRTSERISNGYKRTILKAGDLVMPLRGKVGDVGIVDMELEGANLTRGVAVLAIRPQVSNKFCRHAISSSATRRRLEQSMNGSALQEIPIAALRSFQIGIPSLVDEQESIASTLSDIDNLLASLDRLIAKKRDLKQATMKQLLTGKKRLSSFGVGKPYRETEIGVISEDWTPIKLGQAVTFSGGSQPPRSTFLSKPREGYIRLIQIRDYKTNEYETYIPETLAKKKCTKEDIMIGRYGPPIFQILRGIEGAYNVALIKAIPSSKIDREFLYHFIQNEELFKLMDMLSQRSSGQTGVELPALRDYPLALPPEKEQIAIAQVLTDMDTELTTLQTRRHKTQALKQAMMQELLTGKTRLPIANND